MCDYRRRRRRVPKTILLNGSMVSNTNLDEGSAEDEEQTFDTMKIPRISSCVT